MPTTLRFIAPYKHTRTNTQETLLRKARLQAEQEALEATAAVEAQAAQAAEEKCRLVQANSALQMDREELDRVQETHREEAARVAAEKKRLAEEEMKLKFLGGSLHSKQLSVEAREKRAEHLLQERKKLEERVGLVEQAERELHAKEQALRSAKLVHQLEASTREAKESSLQAWEERLQEASAKLKEDTEALTKKCRQVEERESTVKHEAALLESTKVDWHRTRERDLELARDTTVKEAKFKRDEERLVALEQCLLKKAQSAEDAARVHSDKFAEVAHI